MYFLHVIANCSCTPRPILIVVAADGSGLCYWQLHFPYGSMAVYALLIADDYEYLMLQYCFVWNKNIFSQHSQPLEEIPQLSVFWHREVRQCWTSWAHIKSNYLLCLWCHSLYSYYWMKEEFNRNYHAGFKNGKSVRGLYWEAFSVGK